MNRCCDEIISPLQVAYDWSKSNVGQHGRLFCHLIVSKSGSYIFVCFIEILLSCLTVNSNGYLLHKFHQDKIISNTDNSVYPLYNTCKSSKSSG